MPQRIQRKRAKGWRMPAGAVYVGRPTKWGNPYRWQDEPKWAQDYYGECEPWRVHDSNRRRSAVTYFENEVKYGDGPSGRYPSQEEIRRELGGKDLACWCPEGEPCHGDVLLALANEEQACPA